MSDATVDRNAALRQIRRILDDTDRFGSDSQRRLLEYLANQAFENPGAPLKEYQIATEVLGRAPDFDPRADAIVRVQAGRLRGKLADYFATAGKADPVVVDLPKGSYTLSFHVRTPETVEIPEAAPEPALAPITPKVGERKWMVPVLSVLAGVALVLCGAMYWRIRAIESAHVSQAKPALWQFWRPFLTAKQPPILVFSNAAFAGNPLVGMRYFDPTKDRAVELLDYYTGVGEVLASVAVSRVFSESARELRVKRGRLLTMDDARVNDLVFIGSRGENLPLRELPAPSEFRFSFSVLPDKSLRMGIENLHPRPGEPERFLTPQGPPIEEDYGLIALTRGISDTSRILILAGTTTFGTQATAEFAANADRIAELVAALGKAGLMSPAGPLPFEAVLKVTVRSGVPIRTEIVTIHAESGPQGSPK